jgi:FecR-like protein
MTPLNCLATKAGALLALLLATRMAVAEPAGIVSDSTGPLLAKSASGSIKVLVVGSSVSPLDTLVSRHGVYARVTLTDHSDLALGPDTELAIEKYSFHDKDPQANTAVLRLAKGSVRVTSGALGTRNTDTFTLVAGATTIDIHRSVFVATYIEQPQASLGKLDEAPPRASIFAATDTPAMGRPTPGHTYLRVSSFPSRPAKPLELTDSPIQLAQNGLASPATLNPGLYVQVLDGAINVSNGSGSQNFTAGQFGFTPSVPQPPVILPANPGMQFTPPPSFSSTTGSQNGASGSKPGDVDCVVR